MGERVSLLVVELRAARNWLEHGLAEGLCRSLRIINVLGYEISLKTGSHGSRSTPTPACLETCGCLPHQALHELTGAEKVDTDAGRSHRIADTGHRTADTRRVDTGRADTGRADTGHADTGHVPDAGHWTRGRWTCGR